MPVKLFIILLALIACGCGEIEEQPVSHRLEPWCASFCGSMNADKAKSDGAWCICTVKHCVVERTPDGVFEGNTRHAGICTVEKK